MKGSQKIRQSLSCRNRPLEVTVPATIEREDESKEESPESNQNGCDKKEGEDKTEEEDIEDNIVYSGMEIYWRIYHGGIESSIRSQVNRILCGLENQRFNVAPL